MKIYLQKEYCGDCQQYLFDKFDKSYSYYPKYLRDKVVEYFGENVGVLVVNNVLHVKTENFEILTEFEQDIIFE